jgi:SAM-dependent methyltransferase
VAQDSSRPDFWDTRFRGGVTPWDAGDSPAFLKEWLGKRAPCRVLIPGCGTGYEVRLFARHGHDVLAIDFSAAAIEAARKELGEALARLVAQQDFFAFDSQPFDLVYERAFLCALPRRLWPQWARRLAALVRPGGELAGFFYLDDNERGPPFGVAPRALRAMLQDAFELTEEKAIAREQSIAVFKGKEVWQVWRRKL